MSDLVVRPAAPDEAKVVAGFVHALVDELSGGQGPSRAEMCQTADLVLNDKRVIALLAEQQGEVLGLLVLNECVAIYA